MGQTFTFMWYFSLPFLIICFLVFVKDKQTNKKQTRMSQTEQEQAKFSKALNRKDPVDFLSHYLSKVQN